MPLMKSKSKQAFSKNVATEMNAGKPQPQALAIAYNLKRKAKKMAFGGKAEDTQEPGMPMAKPDNRRLDKADYMSDDWAGGPDPKRMPDDERLDEDEYMASSHMGVGLAKGGNVKLEMSEQEPDEDREERSMSTVDSIMQKRSRLPKRMADGGQVDLERNSEEFENVEDDLSFDALKKEQYDDSQLGAQPEDSNEMGHDLPDEDSHDMVDRIRKKIKYKQSIG